MILGGLEILPDKHEIARRIRRRRARLREVVPRILKIRLCLCEAVHRRMIGADLALHVRHIGEVAGDIVQDVMTCRHRSLRPTKNAERTRRCCRRAHEASAPHPPSYHTHAFSILSRSGSASP